jgi:hypothetical protein
VRSASCEGYDLMEDAVDPRRVPSLHLHVASVRRLTRWLEREVQDIGSREVEEEQTPVRDVVALALQRVAGIKEDGLHLGGEVRRIENVRYSTVQ